ncbi:CubicO group peptidase (beta-lactamase class C family) [Catenulispora sp. GP43]|uniref:serine hydrolase domain-containing protein n=1 Tax=Catenulispora sp. GP43 TaxID=3156263 RepID=UPI0035114B3D
MFYTEAASAHSLQDWLEPPANRWAYNHVESFLPTAAIPRGQGTPRPFTEASVPLEDVEIDMADDRATVAEFLELTQTDGIVVLHGGHIVFERYFGEGRPDRRHALMSISKSIAGMAAGCLVGEGSLDVSAPVQDYVPELAASAFGSATVGQVLDMTAALRFSQEYRDPASEVQALDRAAGWRPRTSEDGSVRDLLAALKPDGPHGLRTQYTSATTDVLAWVLERAAGQPYAEVISDRIWSRIGAEHDAVVTVDPKGTPYACAGVNATARDLARFGRCVLDGGSVRGTQVIPEAWVRSTRDGQPEAAPDADFRRVHPHGSYRNQWWITGDAVGSFLGIGIYGQYIWLDPVRDVVIAKQSSLLGPRAQRAEHASALTGIAAAVAARRPHSPTQEAR